MPESRQKKPRSRDYAILFSRMTLRVLYSAEYHRHHCTPQAFEQFGELYMHNHDDKYPPDRDSNLIPPGYKPQFTRISQARSSSALGPPVTHPLEIKLNVQSYTTVGLQILPQHVSRLSIFYTQPVCLALHWRRFLDPT